MRPSAMIHSPMSSGVSGCVCATSTGVTASAKRTVVRQMKLMQPADKRQHAETEAHYKTDQKEQFPVHN